MAVFNIKRIVYLFLFSILTFSVLITNANTASNENIQILPDENGIRIVVSDIEFYFNATNGGEITEYFDLTVDPDRSKNLVMLEWPPWYNLLPLFTSLFYKPPYSNLVFSTGGDSNAGLWLIANTSEYAILQSSSRIMDRMGRVAKDVYGNPIYINSTWIIRNSGLISVERTFFIPSYATVPSGWRWYPFYLTRDAGFNSNGTFFMFNTTYAYGSVVNQTTYRDVFSLFSLLPSDTRNVFGVAFPFSNTSIGGDGTHNILIAYKYDELVNVDEWRSDNYYSETRDVIEGGAVYEFNPAFKIFTHTYHALLNFTHQPVDNESLQNFADYYASDTTMALLMGCSVTTNQDTYNPGEHFVFSTFGTSFYNFMGITARFTVKNSLNKIVYQRNYGPGDINAGQTFNLTLLEGNVQPFLGNYTIGFQIFSPFGIKIASDSKVITVSTP